MSTNFPYQNFSEYIIRTPLFSINKYLSFTQNETINEEQFKKLVCQTELLNGVFFASPPLFREINKWLENELLDSKKQRKLEESLFKYFTRATSRCSPFGLFAGCAIGEIKGDVRIVKDPDQNNVFTRFNVNYLEEIFLSEERGQFTENSIFHTNSSIYRIGFKYRYFEPYMVKQQLKYRISEVPYSPYLEYIINESSEGLSVKTLQAKFLQEFSSGISKTESASFIIDIIESRILLSHLELSVTGLTSIVQLKDYLSTLGTNEKLDNIFKTFEQISVVLNNKLNDRNLPNIVNSLYKKSGSFSKSPIDVEMFPHYKENRLSKDIVQRVKNVLIFLNKISYYPKEKQMDFFIKKFIERFGERQVPIAIALDVESGINFKPSFPNCDDNPLIDDLVFTRKSEELKFPWNSTFQKLNELIIEALKENKPVISLNTEDWNDNGNSWEDLPDTFLAMIKLTGEDESQIEFLGSGGSSAANLISRFSHGNPAMLKFVKKISETEKALNPNKILAEIAHIPEYRLFNIMNRPHIRDFEIPYLSGFQKDTNVINLEDILLKVENGRNLVIVSKKHNKEIIPHLSTAHSFQNSTTLPIYHFLSEYQFYKKRKSIYFEIGPLKESHDFIPRIEYENVILSRATWNLKQKDLESCYPVRNNWKKLKLEIAEFLKKKKLPSLVDLPDGEEKIIISFKNYNSVKMLLDSIKNQPTFQLVENLSNNRNCVQDLYDEHYSHEILLGFHKRFNYKK
ncbi:lantibiotic dehydratase family protein [Christiangramia sp. LLG6405-1]|uniref:lantibiotic dehydratase family protein n=1 Tax=Christiangramia sp. LLG6405-1 TaxID=3160832 RepID=UPI0038640682